MHTFSFELRSLPVWLLHEYLENVGGRLVAQGQYHGQGWQAVLTPMEDYVIGSLRVGQIRLVWEGDESAYRDVWPKLEQKLLRAGG